MTNHSSLPHDKSWIVTMIGYRIAALLLCYVLCVETIRRIKWSNPACLSNNL